MSSVRNIDPSAESNVKQGGRIVHPLFAKCVTKDENASCKSFRQANRIISSTLPLNTRACGSVGVLDPLQMSAAKPDTRGYNKQLLSSSMSDSASVSTRNPELVGSDSETKLSSGSLSVLVGQSSKAASKDNFTDKNKKSSVDQKRFYQRKFSGFSGIKLPVGRLFKFLKPPLQRRNSCPVLSISELKSGAKLNGTSEAKPEVDLPNSTSTSNREINNKQNLNCRLTKWTSHSELLHSEINHPNISRENISPSIVGGVPLRSSYVHKSANPQASRDPENFISSLEVNTSNSLDESGQTDCTRNFETSTCKISKTKSGNIRTEPFVLEKTVIIVSENTPDFSSISNTQIYDSHLNSSYISNIDTSISSMNNAFSCLDAGKSNNRSKKENGQSIDQVKVINSLPFKSELDWKEELSHNSHNPIHQSPTNTVEVYGREFQEKNIIEGTYQKTQENVCYSNFNNLEKGVLRLQGNSTDDSFCRLRFTQGKVHSSLISSGPTSIHSGNGAICIVKENGQLSSLQHAHRDNSMNTNCECKTKNALDILQSRENIVTTCHYENSCDTFKTLTRNSEKYVNCEPLYAVVQKFSSNKTQLLNKNGTDNCHETNVDSRYVTQAYQISENCTNRTLAYFGCRETVKTSINKGDELKINPALYICEVNNSFVVQNNEKNPIGSISSNNVSSQEGSYQPCVVQNGTTGVCSNLKSSSTSDQDDSHEIQEVVNAQPQLISIIYNPVGDKNLSESFADKNACPNSSTNVDIENAVYVKNDVLDFGENISNTSLTDLQNSHINECYNVKLDAPEEVIVAGFHDFCHTMLSLEESTEMHDTGTIKRRPGNKEDKTKLKANPNVKISENHLKNISGNAQNNILSPELSRINTMPSTLDGQDAIAGKTSTAMGEERSSSSDKLLEEIQNSKSLGKMSIKDPDVIDAIRALDNSLMEISESTAETEIDNLSQINSETTNSNEEIIDKHDLKGPVKVTKEDKIQCDNLIEELMLEGISKRVSDASESSDSSSVLGGGIAVTISSMNTQQTTSDMKDTQNFRTRKDSNQEQNTENSDYWLSTRLSNSPRISSTISDVNSCNLNEISSDACTSDFCDPDEEMKKVNRISDSKTESFPFPASIPSESPSAVYPLQVSVDHNSTALLQNGTPCNRTSPCSVDSGTSSHNQGYFVVVAIDFGTTYSGYAFSFTRDPDNIHMMKKWDGGDPGVFNQKTPTTLLLSPEGTFHSFGYSARDYYHDLDEEEAKGWMYFEKFKMTLHHSEHLSLETEITAANGKRMPAVTVFAHALRYFKDHALQELSDQSATKILNEDVRWVVTVPAIWKQPAKQFMRAAAYKAGVASPDYPEQLLIALEPEAASIYCRRMRLHQLVPDETHFQRSFQWQKEETELETASTISDKDFSSCGLSVQGNDGSFTAGTRYMVVDCGGGTVDITVHELLDKQGTLKELQKASGGPYGAIGVDMEFEKLLCDIVGEDFIQQFKSKRPTGYVDLMIAFEARKRNANPYKTNPLNISLPYSFIEYYEKFKGSSVEAAIKKSSHKNVKWSSQGMLRLEPSAMEGLFRRTVEKIRQHIESIINQKDIRIDHIFLVGGFAESLILQKEIKDAFSSRLRVIIPQGVSLAILKGAVLFGLDPTTINIRRLRMTYGVGVLNRFIHGVHPREKLVVKDGIPWCADVFDKFVVNEQSVDVGDVVVRRYTPAKDGQSCSVIHIYCSEKDNVYFITDQGVKRCATLILDLSDSRYIQGREIQTQMMFGDTEIKVSALDVTTGKCVKAEIDFLNQ